MKCCTEVGPSVRKTGCRFRLFGLGRGFPGWLPACDLLRGTSLMVPVTDVPGLALQMLGTYHGELISFSRTSEATMASVTALKLPQRVLANRQCQRRNPPPSPSQSKPTNFSTLEPSIHPPNYHLDESKPADASTKHSSVGFSALPPAPPFLARFQRTPH
jgi:hypothetical protein